MAVTRRFVLSLAPALALAAGNRKKDKGLEGGAIKVVEMAVHRTSTDPLITIDGRIVNSGTQAIRNLVLVFEVTGMDGRVVSRQRGKVEEDPLDPGQESEFHWEMRDQPKAVEVSVRAVAHDEQPVRVEEPGPYPIE
jgi:hypothetical protein